MNVQESVQQSTQVTISPAVIACEWCDKQVAGWDCDVCEQALCDDCVEIIAIGDPLWGRVIDAVRCPTCAEIA